MPASVTAISTPAHRAIGSGFSITTRQLVSTAASTLTRWSSSIGIATTDDANTGAAISPPSASQTSNTGPCGASTTRRMKSTGSRTGPDANTVISDAEVST